MTKMSPKEQAIYQLHQFDEKDVYRITFAQFRRDVKKGLLTKVTLMGFQDGGFYIIASMTSGLFNERPCILVTNKKNIRFIKNADNVHDLLFQMGVTDFAINTSNWDIDASFNGHKASTECRLRKKRRNESLGNHIIYLRKYFATLEEATIEDGIDIMVTLSVGNGWLTTPPDIAREDCLHWFNPSANAELNSAPQWAAMAACSIVTGNNIFPSDEKEMSVFASIWFLLHGAFDGVNASLESLPSDFISDVVKSGVPREHIEAAFHDEVVHLSIVSTSHTSDLSRRFPDQNNRRQLP